MLELMAVITLMAILLGIASQAIKPDRAAAAIKQVGGSISIWSAKAMADDTSYRMEFTKNLLEVYNEDNVLIHSLKIISDLTFVDHSGNPKTNQTIVFNKMGGMNDLQGTKIYADEWVARVNGFTGHLAYYDDEEED